MERMAFSFTFLSCKCLYKYDENTAGRRNLRSGAAIF